MRRTRFKLILAAVGTAIALGGLQFAEVPTAGAAKVRKKSPQESLQSRKPAAQADQPDASAPVSTPIQPATRAPAIAYPQTGLICLYGQRTDPETNVVECLSPEQLDPPRLVVVNTRPLAEHLGMLSKTSGIPMPDAGVGALDGGQGAVARSAFEARVVRVSFENGAVGGAQRALRSRTDAMAKCVDDHGGLRAESARLKLLFFVRADKKASGMIVASARNIPVPVVRCIRQVIQEGTVGHPSTNPVGVQVLIELKANEGPLLGKAML